MNYFLLVITAAPPRTAPTASKTKIGLPVAGIVWLAVALVVLPEVTFSPAALPTASEVAFVALAVALYAQILDQGTPIDSIMDYNETGTITLADAVAMVNIILGELQNTRIFNGKFEINSSDLKNCIRLSKDGQTIVSMGLGGINTAYLSAKNISCGNVDNTNNGFIGTTIRSSDGAIIIDNGDNRTTIEANKITLDDGNGHTKVITATS